jgi:hypothetical protein
MKTFRSTGILTICVIAIAAYTYWDYQKSEGKEAATESQEIALFKFKNDDVRGVRLKTKDADIELIKDGDQWKMLRPIEDLADNSSVEAFLYSVISHKGKVFRDTDEEKTEAPLERFGLNPPGAKVEIVTEKGKQKTTELIEVGSKNAYDGSFYVLQDKNVYLSDTGMAQVLARTPDSFRSKQMWRDPNVTIDWAEAVVNLPEMKSKFKIVQEGELWTLDPKPPFEVDKGKVANWLLRVEQLSAVEVKKDDPTAEDEKRLLMTKPSLVVTLHHKDPQGKEGRWILTAGQDMAEDVYMRTSERNSIYRGLSPNFDKLRVPLEYFRDGKKGFQFPVEQAAKIEVTIGHGPKKKPYVFVKDASNWKIQGAEAQTSHVKVEKLVSMIQALTKLEAQEFVPNAKPSAFKPEQRLIVRDAKDQILIQLDWGGVLPGQLPANKKTQFVLVKSNLEQDVMAVKASDMMNLVDPRLIEDGAAGAPVKSGTPKK